MKTLKPKTQTIDTRIGSSSASKRIRGWELTKIRDRIGSRDEYICQICGRSTAHGEVDHKTPLHLGGAESDENRWWLCLDCHAAKNEQEGRERQC